MWSVEETGQYLEWQGGTIWKVEKWGLLVLQKGRVTRVTVTGSCAQQNDSSLP